MLCCIYTQQYRATGIRFIGETARFFHLAESNRNAGIGHGCVHLQRSWRNRRCRTITGCAIVRAIICAVARATTRRNRWNTLRNSANPPVCKKAGDSTYGEDEENNEQYATANLTQHTLC